MDRGKIMVFILDEQQQPDAQPRQRFVLQEEEPQQQRETLTQFAPGAQITEETAKDAIRGIARAGARAAETVVGLPGDIAELGETITDFLGSKVGLPTRQELVQRAEEKGGRKTALSINIPGSREFNEFTSEITDGYLDPRNGGEEFADEVVRDFTSLALGKSPSAQGIKAIAKPLITAIGANAIKEGAEFAGAGPKTQAALKIGTMLTLDLMQAKSPTDLKNELYKDASDNLPKGVKIGTKKLVKKLDVLEKKLKFGGSTPEAKPILDKIKELKKAVKGNKIEVKELQAFKRNLNKTLEPEFAKLGKKARNKLIENGADYRKVIKEGISDYGKTNEPFINAWSKAEEVQGAIEQSRRVRTNITRSIKNNPKFSTGFGLGVLAPLGIGASKTGAIVALPVAAGGIAALEFGSRVLNSPTLRTHYKDIMISSLKDDAAGITNSINKYNRDIKKELDEDEEFNALFQRMLDEQK
jgi:hypothetical protein